MRTIYPALIFMTIISLMNFISATNILSSSAPLLNGGFENWSGIPELPDNWEKNYPSILLTKDDNSQRSGSYCVYLSVTENTILNIWQEVVCNPGDYLSFNAWGNVTGNAVSQVFRVELEWYDSFNSRLGGTLVGNSVQSGTYTQSGTSGTAPVNTAKAKLIIALIAIGSGSSFTTSFNVDDATLTGGVEEFSSLLVLPLSILITGIGIFIRRKK